MTSKGTYCIRTDPWKMDINNNKKKLVQVNKKQRKRH